MTDIALDPRKPMPLTLDHSRLRLNITAREKS
jgi:hypothetical protein